MLEENRSRTEEQFVFVCDTDPVLLDGGTVVSQRNLGSRGSEVGQAQDGQVLVVEPIIVHNHFLHFFHHWQNPRFAFICPVGCKKQSSVFRTKTKECRRNKASMCWRHFFAIKVPTLFIFIYILHHTKTTVDVSFSCKQVLKFDDKIKNYILYFYKERLNDADLSESIWRNMKHILI